MPVSYFRIAWPDQTEATCYSPSTVVESHFEAGAEYPLDDFLARARAALGAASERVRQRYGYACSSAMDQLAQIEATAERYATQPDARVRFLGFGR